MVEFFLIFLDAACAQPCGTYHDLNVYPFYNSDSTGQSTWEYDAFPALRIFSAFYGSPGFITVLTKPNYWSLPWDGWWQSHHIYFKGRVTLFPSRSRYSLRPLTFKRSYQAHNHFCSIPYMLHTTNAARLSPRYEGKTRGCHCSRRAPDDGRENARNMLSCK